MSDQSIVLQLRAIRATVEPFVNSSSRLHFEIANSLNRIREALTYSSTMSLTIASSVRQFTQPVKSSDGQPPYPTDARAALLLCDQLLAIVAPPNDSEIIPRKESPPISRITQKSKTVFIVHGHDEANLIRLRSLLKERYGLTPVILMEEPSSGQTVIEKFERAANDAAFCLVLMTPDDQVKSIQGEITQARPNVIFELG